MLASPKTIGPIAISAFLALMPIGCGGDAPATAPAPTAPTAPPAATAPAAPKAASGAALEYQAVLAKFPDSSSENARYLVFNTMGISLDASRAKGSWPSLARTLEQAQPQIEALLRVTEMSDCTFAEVTSDGKTRKLPPETIELFRGIRNGGAMLAADAARTFVAGDTAGAARRAAGLASMLRHIAGSGLPTSGEFATDLLTRLDAIVPPMTAGVNGTKLTDADRATLLAALDTLNPTDPCGYADGAANNAFAAKQAATLAKLKAGLGG
ncbi:MAG: hypothetical protein RLY21_1218 [Planctomycetota bacterium]|jgi:hypothetical protein